MSETGSDERLKDAGATIQEVLEQFEADEKQLNAEDERMAEMPVPKETDPGEDFPAPDYSDAEDPDAKEPAPDFDPLPPPDETADQKDVW